MDVFSKNNTTKQVFEKDLEPKVLNHMVRIYVNITQANRILKKEDQNKFMEASLSLTFILADTFSRFYELMEMDGEVKSNIFISLKKILGIATKHQKNKQRFCSWVNSFVLSDDNEVYKIQKWDINCNADFVWKLRNALLHFFGLPNLKKPKRVMLLNGHWNDEEGYKMISFFKKKGIDLKVVDYLSLEKAILGSIKPWQQYLMKKLKTEPERYVNGIMRILKITENEESYKIDMKTGKKIE